MSDWAKQAANIVRLKTHKKKDAFLLKESGGSSSSLKDAGAPSDSAMQPDLTGSMKMSAPYVRLVNTTLTEGRRSAPPMGIEHSDTEEFGTEKVEKSLEERRNSFPETAPDLAAGRLEAIETTSLLPSAVEQPSMKRSNSLPSSLSSIVTTSPEIHPVRSAACVPATIKIQAPAPVIMSTSRTVIEDHDSASEWEHPTKRVPEAISAEVAHGLLELYWTMKKRWWERVTRGQTGKVQSFHFIWFLLYALADTIFVVVRVPSTQSQWMELVVLILISGIFTVLSPRYNWSTRLLLMEFYIGTFVFFSLNIYSGNNLYSGLILLISVGLSMFFTAIFFLIYPYITRWYVIRLFSMAEGPTLVEDPTNPDERSYEFEERSFGWFCYFCPQYCPPPVYKCVYKGPIRNGRPNGMGQWMDTNWRGEHLVGYFEDGEPVGPFESEEKDTANLFSNLRIMFATDGKGFRRTVLRFGIASVECPISGSFLSGYPLVNLIKSATECRCAEACTCIKKLFDEGQYRHINEMIELKTVVVAVDQRTASLSITGFEPKHKKPTSVHIGVEKVGKSLRLTLDENWLATDSAEGLLFIHGLNHNLEDGIRRFGQLLAMGHFPPRIKPFLFHWPAGQSLLNYWCAFNVSGETTVHYDLQRYLESLANAGIRQLHVVMHSMGTRVFLRSFAAIKELLVARFPNVRDDGTYAAWEGDQTSPSPQLHSHVHETPDPQRSTGISLLSLTFVNPDYDLENFRDTDFPRIRKYCDQITLYADNRDVAIRCARCFHSSAFCLPTTDNLGHCVRPITSRRSGRVLDMDVIDTSDLQHNMSSAYHSAFNVNRGLVDDLHDVIVGRLRAEERRSRLIYRDGYYRFIVVPPSIVVV